MGREEELVRLKNELGFNYQVQKYISELGSENLIVTITVSKCFIFDPISKMMLAYGHLDSCGSVSVDRIKVCEGLDDKEVIENVKKGMYLVEKVTNVRISKSGKTIAEIMNVPENYIRRYPELAKGVVEVKCSEIA